MNKKGVDYLAEEILNFKINIKRKDLVTKKKDYLIYKIKYIDYDNDDDSSN